MKLVLITQCHKTILVRAFDICVNILCLIMISLDARGSSTCPGTCHWPLTFPTFTTELQAQDIDRPKQTVPGLLTANNILLHCHNMVFDKRPIKFQNHLPASCLLFVLLGRLFRKVGFDSSFLTRPPLLMFGPRFRCCWGDVDHMIRKWWMISGSVKKISIITLSLF